ncbi:hypothetical protein [Pontibacter mangrovi]|uniref:Uncharacterized protein n=1 Tax=Pontibacter mangrovi TaxID=2589816 RepID=A0A501W841_9BACT|nr:hypothetical protein [Pontibacter mangrovi]TPE44204.1 hypothetical protein FJM65_08550 [Pontibacter mangrovi]
MERNNQNYHREFDNKLHNEERWDNRGAQSRHSGHENERRDGFQNYRDRYSNRHGNYYGMQNENAAYQNVRSSNPDPNFGYRSGGPVGGYDASSYRGTTDSSRDHYHYGDPNPYMQNSRNRQNEGYERTRGTGWGAEDNYGTYGSSRGTSYSQGGYNRQDNSYRTGGEGRRYNEYNRDEDRKMYRGRSDHGYNMLGIDAYYDRGEQPQRREDNNYRGRNQSDYSNRHFDDEDMRYSGEIRNSDRRDNYASGLYASNRSYVSDHDDHSQRSSRYRRPGETSGPDYGYESRQSSYGNETPRA